MPDDHATIKDLIARMHAGDEFAMGYKPELDLKRHVFDHAKRLRADAVPATFMVKGYRKLPVYAQQGSTCVGNGIAAAHTHNEYNESGEVVAFDGEALNARVTHTFDTPTNFGAVMSSIMAAGVESNAGQGVFFDQGYANVDYHDADAIRAAVAALGQMCVFATWLTRGFTDCKTPTQPLPPSPGETGMGIHCMLLVGYEPRGVWVQNNWGVNWGDAGHCLLSWEYVAAHFCEVMAITDQADAAGGFIKTHQFGTLPEEGVKHADLPDRKRPAVYLVKNNGRIWITDPAQAKRYGVDLTKIHVLPDGDMRWALPVIGPDAPKSQR